MVKRKSIELRKK